MDILNRIKGKLFVNGKNLHDLIIERKLYFRLSITDSCNINCSYCHNEGSLKGTNFIQLEKIIPILRTVSQIGFDRIQITGGEPFLHPDIFEILKTAKKYFIDVGITTNGLSLNSQLNFLSLENIDRMHISLVNEFIILNQEKWLIEAVKLLKNKKIAFRLNVPIEVLKINQISNIVKFCDDYECEIMIMPILSSNQNIFVKMNKEFNEIFNSNKIQIRKFRHSQGVRCSACSEKKYCKEFSRSLRLSASYILKPCLATRNWDIEIDYDILDEQIVTATLLALDY